MSSETFIILMNKYFMKYVGVINTSLGSHYIVLGERGNEFKCPFFS